MDAVAYGSQNQNRSKVAAGAHLFWGHLSSILGYTQKFGGSKIFILFYFFERNVFCSPKLHLFLQK